MGSLSNYAENKVLDHILGKASYTMPTVYVGLSTADPTEDGSGAAEPSGNAYARVATSATTWNSAASGATSNAEAIAFTEATGSWGTVAYFVLYDAQTSGNLIAYGALTTSKTVTSGDTVQFPIGGITFTLD